MSRYRETLHRWAERYIPDEARVVRVVMNYDDGYDPTFTDRPASLSVSIAYDASYGGETWTDPDVAEVLTSVGELLTELFAIEDDATATATADAGAVAGAGRGAEP